MNSNLKKEKKKILSLMIIMSLIIITVIGVTYAIFLVSDIIKTFSGTASCYTVNYTKGQDITNELVAVDSYIEGGSTDIVMYSDPDCAKMKGTLYITTNAESTMDFSDNALRYTVVVNEVVVSEGAVDGTANQPIYSNFNLNTTETTYKVYIWLDASLEIKSGELENISGFIHADAVLISDIVD